MSETSAGGFRANLFGGFNRRDVLNHVQEVYLQLDEYRRDNEALEKRCEELEQRLQEAEEARLAAEGKQVKVRKKQAKESE